MVNSPLSLGLAISWGGLALEGPQIGFFELSEKKWDFEFVVISISFLNIDSGWFMNNLSLFQYISKNAKKSE